MKILTFDNLPHHLSKLHDELLASVPSVRPVGTGENRRAVMTISGDGTDLVLQVPDGADEAAIRTVVAAHDSTPLAPPVDPNEELSAAITSVDTSTITDEATKKAIDDLKAALLGQTRQGRVSGRRI